MRTPFIALALIVAAAAPLEAGSLKLGSAHKDESSGFKINPPKKWEMVPTKFQEVSIVGKWVAKRTNKGYLQEMYVLRFLKGKIENAANPQEALKRGMRGLVVRIARALVACVTDPVAVPVFLPGIGVQWAVVDTVGHRVAVQHRVVGLSHALPHAEHIGEAFEHASVTII